jgi:hypothetical protein
MELNFIDLKSFRDSNMSKPYKITEIKKYYLESAYKQSINYNKYPTKI